MALAVNAGKPVFGRGNDDPARGQSSPSPHRKGVERSADKNLTRRSSRRFGFFNWHSHTVSTRQPIRRSFPNTSRSRATLPSSFTRQNFRLLAGVLLPRWHECRCQKQPWTNTILPSRGKTRSGVPVRSRRWSRTDQRDGSARRFRGPRYLPRKTFSRCH